MTVSNGQVHNNLILAWWVGGLQDLWDISPKIASRTVSPEFQRNYQVEKDKFQATGPKAGYTTGTGEVSEITLEY